MNGLLLAGFFLAALVVDSWNTSRIRNELRSIEEVVEARAYWSRVRGPRRDARGRFTRVGR